MDEAIRAEGLTRPGEVMKRSRGDEAARLGPELADQPKLRDNPTRETAGPKPPPSNRSDLDAAGRRVTEAERKLSTELDS